MDRWRSSRRDFRCWSWRHADRRRAICSPLRAKLRAGGALVLLAAPDGTPDRQLPLASSTAEDLDPVLAIQSFDPAVEALARARGRDPDPPPRLHKVSRTR